MSKVMIVEDDDSLREIYAIRLTAEGYAVVSAHDGEEALAVAVRERPDLIISDVMMPKISGFDMLDILRSTPETANIRVIMMTALSSEDQRERGEGLGADRYLVKSQVGIEDVVNTVHDVLGDRSTDGVINTDAPDAPGVGMEPQPIPQTEVYQQPVPQADAYAQLASPMETYQQPAEYQQPAPEYQPAPEAQAAQPEMQAPAPEAYQQMPPVAPETQTVPDTAMPPITPTEQSAGVPDSIMPPVNPQV